MTENSEQAASDIRGRVSKVVTVINHLIQVKWVYVILTIIGILPNSWSTIFWMLVLYGVSYVLLYYHLLPPGFVQCMGFVVIAGKPLVEPTSINYLSLLDMTIRIKGTFIREWKGEERREVLVENTFYFWLNTVECQLTGRFQLYE